ncbi:MAG: C_GCAxxG_C_C family protein [Brachyspira sp.]|nr:C_GCAxxG_C_C family protein [Brachyspira sp.]
MNSYSQKAMNLFKEGYNCAQSVFLAFAEDLGFDKETALKLSSSFGGGMGRMREVCGAVSAMFMIAGLKYGYTSPTDKTAKTEHYERIQELAKKFKDKHETIICRELLGVDADDNPIPSDRTPEYYASRPCERLIGDAAEIISEYIKSSEKICK